MILYISTGRVFPVFFFPGLYYDLLKLDVFFSLFREEQCVAHHGKKSPGTLLEILFSGSMVPINSFHSQL